MALTPLELFFALLIGHALCDYPLQGDFLARAKNATNPIPGVPWPLAMAAHTAIHAGAVWFLTGTWMLGLFEFLAHWLIDELKCRGKLDFGADQALHVVCKLVWVILLAQHLLPRLP